MTAFIFPDLKCPVVTFEYCLKGSIIAFCGLPFLWFLNLRNFKDQLCYNSITVQNRPKNIKLDTFT